MNTSWTLIAAWALFIWIVVIPTMTCSLLYWRSRYMFNRECE